MVAVDFGTCKAFVTDLWNANLISHAGLKACNQYLQQKPQANPESLANHLVEMEVLTRFQADRVLQGGAADLTVWSFVLVDILGEGALGTAYKALNRTEKGYFVIKVLPPRRTANIPKTSSELQAFKQFRHPSVVPIVHVGAGGERPYLVWPYVEGGETLQAIVGRQGRLPPKEVVFYGLQIARGLQLAHEHGLFHGQLKPSDFLIGADKKVSILDFGIGFLLTAARGESLLDTRTNTNQLSRGIDFASPESILDTTARTPAGDQYSLGCVLYYCLTGQVPFPGVNYTKKVMAHQFDQATPIRELAPHVPARLAAIVERMMAKAPEERFANVQEVGDALRALIARPNPGQGSTPDLPDPVAASPTTPTRPSRAVPPLPKQEVAKATSGVRPAAAKSPKSAPPPAPKAKPQPARRSWVKVLLWLGGVAVVAGAGVAAWLTVR